MKVYQIVENIDDRYGGPAKSITNTVKTLKQLGIESEILSTKQYSHESNEVISRFKLSWKIFPIKGPKKIRYSKKLKLYLLNYLNQDSDIIHVHNNWNYILYLSWKVSKIKKIPLVISVRGSLYPWSLSQRKILKKIAWTLYVKKIFQQASCIHVTEFNELKAVRHLGISTPIALIPNGVDLEEFKNLPSRTKARTELKINPTRKYLLFLSRIHPKKGLHFLLEQWGMLSSEFNEWTLLIAGEGENKEYWDQIIKIIEQYDLSNRVIFLGLLKNQERINAYAASNLFVLPSETENFGIAIAEAMACKIPVITTKNTPWKEILDCDGGWWIKLSSQELAKALIEALNLDETDLEKKGQNSFDLIQKYSWLNQGPKFSQLYKWVLEENYSLAKPKFIR